MGGGQVEAHLQVVVEAVLTTRSQHGHRRCHGYLSTWCIQSANDKENCCGWNYNMLLSILSLCMYMRVPCVGPPRVNNFKMANMNIPIFLSP